MRTAILPLMFAMLGLGVANTGASAYAAAAATGIAPVPVTDGGLVGQLFQPAHAQGRQPALIVLGGSEGGVGAGAARLAEAAQVSRRRAATLAGVRRGVSRQGVAAGVTGATSMITLPRACPSST